MNLIRAHRGWATSSAVALIAVTAILGAASASDLTPESSFLGLLRSQEPDPTPTGDAANRPSAFARQVESELGSFPKTRQSAAQQDGQRVLEGPEPLANARTGNRAESIRYVREAYPRFALATTFDAPIFVEPRHGSKLAGWVRRGRWLPATEVKGRSGCSGQWYEVFGGGHICSSNGFEVNSDRSVENDFELGSSKPDLSRPLPYRYARVLRREARLFEEAPSPAQIQTLAAKGTAEDTKILDGDYFFALHRRHELEGTLFAETIRGQYIADEDLERLSTPPMHGEIVDEATPLPMAFVYKESPLFCRKDGTLSECGHADKHARFSYKGRLRSSEGLFALGHDGIAVPLNKVRIAKAIKRPSDVPKDTRWIHIDLKQQVLVAYEGDQPVFTTLISSGKPGYDTPSGLYNVYHKFISARMSGDDPREGVYDVDEVPWVMYYHRGYALHGAYWHNDFGQTRSHGCSNLAPVDARWLYYWSSPKVPPGWHSSKRGEGTPVYVTGA